MEFVPDGARSQDDEMPGFADTLEQWPQQRIYGDFYREPVEDVVRGVTFPDTLESASGFKFGGDYYREQEDVFKGLTLAQMPEESMFGLDNGQGQNEKKNPWSWASSTTAATAKSFDEVPCAYQSSSTASMIQAPDGSGKTLGLMGLAANKWDNTGAVSLSCGQFQESDHPPPKPVDPLWSFEVTTAFVQMKHPWVLGNHLINFLTNELASTSIKVSRCPKFALKADVFVGTVKCTLKIRVYSVDEKYAVEFQKRGGDSIAFNRAYSQAVKFLRSHFTVDSPSKEMPRSPPQIPMVPDVQMAPLLDMASVTQLPTLQAESAAAMAEIAKDERAAPLLLQPEVLKEIKNLLQSNDTDVAFLTSRIMANLSKLPKAAEHIAALGLVPTMIEKVQSGSCSYAQAKELNQAIHLVQKERVH